MYLVTESRAKHFNVNSVTKYICLNVSLLKMGIPQNSTERKLTLFSICQKLQAAALALEKFSIDGAANPMEPPHICVQK